MKCQPLIAIALLFAVATIGDGKSAAEENERNRLQSLLTDDVRRMHLTPLDRAYLDAYTLLGREGQCGQFFIGKGSRKVLGEFVAKLQIRYMGDSRIGIRMFGIYSGFVEPEAGIAYRLFEKMEINSVGAFFRAKTFAAEPLVPNMGSFRPNTREARVLILLHELAHLIKNKDGTWLIPDDGSSSELSRINTLTVESKCGQQIRAL